MKFLKNIADGWGDQAALRWIWNVAIATHVGLGVAILAGGSSRFVVPTYTPLVNLSGGHTWAWGVWILASAFLITVPFRWLNIAGLWIGMVWHLVWCSMFAVALVSYPTSAATPAIMYAGFAMINTALLTSRVLDRKG